MAAAAPGGADARQVDAGETLLDRLANEGVLLPSSCRTGLCGSCEVTVLSGQPEHRDSVLTESERMRGDVMLPCVSRSHSGRLRLAH
jgi:ferredoxin